MSKIFISHSSANNAAALAVAQWLEENGWGENFLDIDPAGGLSPGERWQEALKAAAERCEAVLFLISPAWRDSKWCLAEFLLAKQLDKTIFGILVEPTPLESLPKEMTVEWQLCDLVAGTERRIFQVHADPVVPETELSFAEAGFARLKIGLQKSGLDPATFPWPPPKEPERAPYRGLKALEAEDTAVFFGREAAIVRGLDALRGLRDLGVERMLVILGASGAGKSSFLRAGLGPRLKRDDRHFLPLPLIRPERAVISGPTGLVASLEAAFHERKSAKNRSEIRKGLETPEGFDRLVADLQDLAHKTLGREAEPPTIVIPIDQGEELFTAEGHTEAEQFLSLLGHTLAPPLGDEAEAIATRRRTLAVVAIRSDSYERLQTAARLQAVKQAPFNLPPLARAEFKAVIEGPAKRATDAGRKLTIESALTVQLLEDAEGADALPLLAFTMERLFMECGGDGDLRLDEYEVLGGVQGAIEAAVSAAFADPDRSPVVPSDKAERERVLRQGFIPWLVAMDPETEKPKRRVARWEEIPAQAHSLIERLRDARLLVLDRRRLEDGTGESVTVEVAHEALLRQWSTLTSWLVEDAVELKTAESIKRAAAEWDKNGRAGAWLIHTGERLDAAVSLQQRPDFYQLLGDKGRDYLAACRAKEEAARAEREAQAKRIAEEQERVAVEQKKTARFQRWSARLLVAIAVIVVGAGSWIVVQSRKVERQTSLALATAARDTSDAGFHERALRFAVLAARDRWLSAAVAEAEPQLARAAHESSMVAQFNGHEDIVWSAAFSPDGRRVVTASDDKTARLWDAMTGKALGVPMGHTSHVISALFSLDGQRVMTSSRDYTARVWNVTTGKLLTTLRGDRGSLWSSAFSPDGQHLVTPSQDGPVRVWNATTGKVLATLRGHESEVVFAVFSPDGERVLTAAEDKTARVWHATTGKELAKLTGHENAVSFAAFSPNGQRIVTASDHGARVWDATTGKEVAKLTGHEDSVRSAAFSPDGQRVVTASEDKTARVWDATTGEAVATLTGHKDWVGSASFSPDGRLVVTASDDKTAQVWDVTTGQELTTLKGHEGIVRSAAFSPDGQRVVTASDDKTARVWHATMGKALVTLRGQQDHFRSVVFSPDVRRVMTESEEKTARRWQASTRGVLGTLANKRAAVFSPDGQRVVTTFRGTTARVWDVTTGKELVSLKGHDGSVSFVAFSPDGRRVLTASDDKTARVWDATTGRELATLRGHEGSVRSAAFSRHGERIVTASGDKTARVWEATTGRELATLRGHEGSVRSAAFSPDGRRVVTVSNEEARPHTAIIPMGTARVWDATTGTVLTILKGHNGLVLSAVFSPDGQRVVTASLDATPRVWDAMTGAVLTVLKRHKGFVLSAVFSPDGQRVVTASLDETAQVWDATTGKALATLRGHDFYVISAAFSPDGHRVVTASLDKTARVWDAKTGAEMAQLKGHEGYVTSAMFSRDGDRVVTASNDQTARLWDVRWLTKYHGKELLEAVCDQKLAGARLLNQADLAASPILSGRKGEDVCAPSSVIASLIATVRSKLHALPLSRTVPGS